MGYYSNFYGYVRSLKIFSVREFKERIEKISGYHIDFDNDGAYNELETIMDKELNFEVFEIKWYNYKDDLTVLSKLYPDMEIFVTRYGENNTDMEELYIKNGVVETRELQVIPPEVG